MKIFQLFVATFTRRAKIISHKSDTRDIRSCMKFVFINTSEINPGVKYKELKRDGSNLPGGAAVNIPEAVHVTLLGNDRFR